MDRKVSAFIVILALLTAIALVFLSAKPTDGTETREVRFSNGAAITAETADDPAERQQGLMYRTELCDACGMLFIFDRPQNVSFWMKNTLIPLDMIFISEDMKIVKIYENVQPCEAGPCQNYPSEGPVRYVIEVNGGFSAAKGIKAGDIIQLSN